MRSPRARIVALAVSVGVIGSLAAAPASFAAGAGPQPPKIGTNCQTDGKITGRGSTFQNKAMTNAFIVGYQQDVCGPVGPASATILNGTAPDPTATNGNMVAYNYPSASTGSGAGLAGISCRYDPFTGTDLPYNNSQLAGINGAPGAETGSPANCPTPTSANVPPFGPATTSYPNTSDATVNAMNFPVAGGAVAFAVNLNGMCTTLPPAGTLINLTSSEFEQIWEGQINQWNDTHLTTTNPALSSGGCAGNIQRVVRFDGSGTTAISKFDLNGINGSPVCDSTTNTWASLATASPNTVWPLGCTGDGRTAPAPVSSCSNGSGTLIATLETNSAPVAGPCPVTSGGEGGIGYAELGLWGTLPSGIYFVALESHDAAVANPSTDTPPAGSFISPGSPGNASNCVPGINGLAGGGTPNGAVGLGGTNNNWANDSTTPKFNITYQGAQYPACGLTFDLVYTGMHNETGESTSTADVAQTLPPSGGNFTVVNASDFPSSGTLSVTSDLGPQTITYTGVSGNTFTGATGGSGNVAAGATVTGQVLGSTKTVQGPMQGLTNDQLRTLYSYYTYVFSPLGQSYLDKQTYDELPAAWLPTLRAGYQNNY